VCRKAAAALNEVLKRDGNLVNELMSVRSASKPNLDLCEILNHVLKAFGHGGVAYYVCRLTGEGRFISLCGHEGRDCDPACSCEGDGATLPDDLLP
jgi:hypothetical protein